MTALSHQLVALLSAFFLLTIFPISLGPVLGLSCLVAVMIGALTPDLDQPTANLWKKMIGARTLGRIFSHFSGGHRHMTHSLIGIFAIAIASRWAINNLIKADLVPTAFILWRAYMIGYISHPIADTLTDRGVPWFWPLKWHLRLPPGPGIVRITTGSWVETLLIRGLLLLAGLVLAATRWSVLVDFFQG